MKLYCNEKFVGFLEPRGAEWRAVLEHTPAVPMSPSLSPAKGQTLASRQIKDFFVNYLPEEPYANRVAARLQPYPRTLEDWFAALGQELTGAYALTPDGQELAEPVYRNLPPEKLFGALHESRSRADAIAFHLAQEPSLPRLSLAGAQDKFALWFDAKASQSSEGSAGKNASPYKIAQGRAATTHIFKPESTDTRYPFLPANEFACAQLASALGLPVAHTQITTLGGVRTLIVQRFDRQQRGQTVQRLHQIDLCQLLDVPRERKYGSQGTGIDTADFFKACDRLAVPALARRAHLRAWLFNFLVGNQDAHAKNYSFLHALISSQGWQTAPLYDLICVVPYLPEQSLSMGLLEEYRAGWLEAAHWRELARLAGVSPAYLAQEMRQLVERAQAATPALQTLLRNTLSDEELGFLSQRVNPVVQTRVQYLLGAAASLG
jgi:serine/threonine-protein kinase HipA